MAKGLPRLWESPSTRFRNREGSRQVSQRDSVSVWGESGHWRANLIMGKRYPLLSELSRRGKLKLLKRYLPPNARVLEVGSGEGWFADRVRESGHEVVTLDLVAPAAEVVGDIRDWRRLGLARGSFDAVVALEVIEHVDCLVDLIALCKPRGLILLSSPHPRWDGVMKILEGLRLTQRRTSRHSNLTDFGAIRLERVAFKRPLLIHQVALFRNAPPAALRTQRE